MRIASLFPLALAFCCAPALAQQAQVPSAEAQVEAEALFAVEIKIGPAWDTAKPAQEQIRFREHSAHLKRLRDEGRLVMGARYADKGLVIVTARDLDEARALMDADPSIDAGVFVFEAHPFNVFYPGDIKPAARR